MVIDCFVPSRGRSRFVVAAMSMAALSMAAPWGANFQASAQAPGAAAPAAPAPAPAAPSPAVPAQVTAGVVSIEIAGSPRVGSGVVVHDGGFVATSFSLVAGAKSLTVRYANGASTDVVGFLAARKGKDLVLLKPRKPPLGIAPLKCAEETRKSGVPVILHAGPKSDPYRWYATTLLTVRSGDAVLAGRGESRPAIGGDVDACWIEADGFLPETGVGGGLFTPDGLLEGILLADPVHADRVHAGVHAQHVAALLSSMSASAKPLALLKNYDDPPPTAVPDTATPLLARSGIEERGKPVDARLAGLAQRLLATDAEQATFRPLEDRLRATAKEQVAAERKLSLQLRAVEDAKAGMRPETPDNRWKLIFYETMDPDGRVTMKQEKRLVTEYRFSPRQLKQRAKFDEEAAALRNQISEKQIELRMNEYRIERTRDDLAAGKRRVAALWTEVFFAADPLELRGDDEARDGLRALDAFVAKVGTHSSTLLARAIHHLRLRRLDEAERAAVQAEDADATVGPLVLAIRGRIVALRQGRPAAQSLLSKISKKADDPRLSILLARIELDHGQFAPAERLIRQAAERGADPIECDIALGLLYATAPQKGVADTAKANFHAGRACDATHWNDWRAVLAFSAAQARAKRFDAALEALEEAAASRPPGRDAEFLAWKTALNDRDTLTFPWK